MVLLVRTRDGVVTTVMDLTHFSERSRAAILRWFQAKEPDAAWEVREP